MLGHHSDSPHPRRLDQQCLPTRPCLSSQTGTEARHHLHFSTFFQSRLQRYGCRQEEIRRSTPSKTHSRRTKEDDQRRMLLRMQGKGTSLVPMPQEGTWRNKEGGNQREDEDGQRGR